MDSALIFNIIMASAIALLVITILIFVFDQK